MIQKKSEDAVSPVIGVMLLLVVTIVIAAVVAVFASGVGSEAEPAPTTVLDVSEIYDVGYSDIQITPELTVKKIVSFDSYTFTQEIMLSGADPQAEYKFNNNEEVIYKGHTIRTQYGEWFIDDVQMVQNDGFDGILESELNNPLYTNFLKDYCSVVYTDGEGEGYNLGPVFITINCLAGDILNLEKLSIKVYNANGELKAEKQQNSLSGTLSPGDTMEIMLDELLTDEEIADDDFNAVLAGEKVEVFVLYGEHVIISKEMKVTDP